MKTTGNLIVVSAPSGSGKTSIVQRVLAGADDLVFSVSYTTRPPRQGEENGRDYCFVTPETFRNMVDDGEFFEWAEVYGHHYGTSRSAVAARLADGLDVLLDIDVQGARQVKSQSPEAILVFILPPSYAELARRLSHRALDGEADIRKRLSIARREVDHVDHYDYVVVNDVLDAAVAQVLGIIRAGRCRVSNNRKKIESILHTFWEERDA